MKRFFLLLTAVPSLLAAFAGCSVDQRLTLDGNGGGMIEAEGRALPFAAVAFDDLALIGGYDDAGALYDEVISRTEADLAIRPAVADYSISRTTPHGWTADIRFTDVEGFLGGNTGDAVAELREGDGTATLSIRIDRERAKGWASLVPMLEDPALAAFNPAETVGYGEEEYVTDVLGFTFGEENLPGIRAARVKMEIVAPGPVTSVEGGVQTGERTVAFETPITRLIVPEDPVFWSLTWAEP